MSIPVVRVLIVEGFPIVRWAVRAFLEKQGRVAVVGEAESVSQAVELARSLEPDVILTNTCFPDGLGIDEVAEFVRSGPFRSLAFSEHDTWDCVEAFLEAGGFGFVTKRAPLGEVAEAVSAVAAGRRWISPSIRRVAPVRAKTRSDQLTRRELETVTLIAHGLTSRQIAAQLCVSLKTVEAHRYRIFRKLGIRRVAQLVDYAARHGYA